MTMGEGPGSLDQFLNERLIDPPTSPGEVQKRLAAGKPRQDDTPPPSARPPTVPQPAGTDESRNDPRYPETNEPIDTDESDVAIEPSLAEVVAQLAERAAQYAKLEKRLAAERFAKKSPDGRLRLVVTGDGRPISLDIDPGAVNGPEGDQLGELIAKLIMDARRQVAARREKLEAALHRQDPTEGGAA
ncbi:YbaB/EbfC family nucleoid-associated protein [Actinoallomurus sp. CA-150999]|uniref:YbaB/EbfC family nucleoid-associated protein n=1 Tax=Actinoallomurus sp. CA-150999 TaxID=3239887 RepID=UPI003D9075D9